MFEFVQLWDRDTEKTLLWKQDSVEYPGDENLYWVTVKNGQVTDIVVEVYDPIASQQFDHYCPTEEERAEVSRLSLERLNALPKPKEPS
jgi:hypothetical protein